MKISADVWIIVLALIAYGAGAILGESKKVRAIVFGAGAVMIVVAGAIYLNVV